MEKSITQCHKTNWTPFFLFHATPFYPYFTALCLDIREGKKGLEQWEVRKCNWFVSFSDPQCSRWWCDSLITPLSYKITPLSVEKWVLVATHSIPLSPVAPSCTHHKIGKCVVNQNTICWRYRPLQMMCTSCTVMKTSLLNNTKVMMSQHLFAQWALSNMVA